MPDLAAQFGVSKQRVHQIIRRLGGADADTARAVRREVREEQQDVLVRDFLEQYQDIIADLAASGSSRADIEARFTFLLPDIPIAIIHDGLARAEVIFDVNVQEYAFPTAAIESAVWYALARSLDLSMDLSLAIHQIDLAEAREVVNVLDQQGLEAKTRANILITIASARAHVVNNPTLTITKKCYDEKRREILDDLGLVSAQGVMPWPPTAQTVMKRLGGGYWAEALRSIGLTPDERGRERGLLRFTESDYDNAVVDFLAQANAIGQSPTSDAYREWVESEDRAGRRRPSDASVRLRYASWNNAKRMVAASGARTPASLHLRRKVVAGRSSVSTLSLHRAQDELRRFLAELDKTMPSEVAALVEEFIINYWQEFEYSRRDWLRSIIRMDSEAVERRLQQSGLSRSQRDALEQDPPNTIAALADIYLDKMLGGKNGGPCNTDGWLSPGVQSELDGLPENVVACVKLLHEIRNFLTHSSEEAKSRLQATLEHLASGDSRFTLRRRISRRILLDWLASDQTQRLRAIAESIPATWRAMIVVESVIQSSVDDSPDTALPSAAPQRYIYLTRSDVLSCRDEGATCRQREPEPDVLSATCSPSTAGDSDRVGVIEPAVAGGLVRCAVVATRQFSVCR
jgi:hypothetical protein